MSEMDNLANSIELQFLREAESGLNDFGNKKAAKITTWATLTISRSNESNFLRKKTRKPIHFHFQWYCIRKDGKSIRIVVGVLNEQDQRSHELSKLYEGRCYEAFMR